MDKAEAISNLVGRWRNIAERDLLTARQGLDMPEVVTEAVCYHLQQTVEKYLKAYLVKHQVEFTKSHNIMYLLNLCATIDPTFAIELAEADMLTDYAVEIRYPDDWYMPDMEETNKALDMALKVRDFVLNRLESGV